MELNNEKDVSGQLRTELSEFWDSIKNNWKKSKFIQLISVAIAFSLLGVLFAFDRKRNQRDLKNSLFSALNLPINGDPRWAIFPSSVDEYEPSISRPKA
jgi:hypothetical protein